jgi:hypothetical protein
LQPLVGVPLARPLSDRWLKFGPNYAKSVAPFSVSGFVQLLSRPGDQRKATLENVDLAGRPALLVHTAAKRKIYLARTGKPYPLRIEEPGVTGRTVTFMEFNDPVTVSAPADYVDLVSLVPDRPPSATATRPRPRRHVTR